MELQTLLHADYLDILFDQRNKTYGGYELRRHYAQRTGKAASIALLFTSMLCFYFAWNNNHSVKQNVITLQKQTTICGIRAIEMQRHIQPQLPTASAAHVKTELFTAPKIVQDQNIDPDKLLTPNKELAKVAIGSETVNGANTATDMPGNGNATGNGTGTGTLPNNSTSAKPFTYVSQMPEFLGNMGSYLTNHLHYPDAAHEAGITGRVIIRFVVNEDGSISNATIVRGIGGGCDEEALRVVNSMPKWKPGKQNGSSVKVYYTLPIVFLLQ